MSKISKLPKSKKKKVLKNFFGLLRAGKIKKEKWDESVKDTPMWDAKKAQSKIKSITNKIKNLTNKKDNVENINNSLKEVQNKKANLQALLEASRARSEELKKRLKK